VVRVTFDYEIGIVATNDFHPQKDKVRDQNEKTKKANQKSKIVSKKPNE